VKSTPKARAKVFLSYRRDDTAGYVRLLYDRLSSRMPGILFLDRESIRLGEDFPEAIRRELESCEVLIALISKQWLSIADARGGRRLDDPKDWVRIEIKTALERNIRVIPALLGGAPMPRADQLPSDLVPLSNRNALEISDNDIASAVSRLLKELPRPPLRRWKKVALVLLLLLAGIGAWRIGKGLQTDTDLAAFRRARASHRVPAPVEASMGITIWRCPPVSGEMTEQNECTPVRVGPKTRLHAGDRLRMTVESPRTGNLYVVDREQYADGRAGEPWLLFPTLRTKDGDNQIRAGDLIQIPGPTDPRLNITLRPGPNSIGESLVFLVTPRPLDGIQLDLVPIKLSPELVEQWKYAWQTTVKAVEFAEGSGQRPTQAETDAIVGRRRLTFEDQVPQTIYYLKAKPGAPLFVEVPLTVDR
jgi:hypothetical protein